MTCRDVRVANNNDDLALVRRGLLKPEEVRRQTIKGVVDSGAAKLVLPQTVVKQLGLALTDRVTVRYADGRTAQRREAEGVYVELLGRRGVPRPSESGDESPHSARRCASGVRCQFLYHVCKSRVAWWMCVNRGSGVIGAERGSVIG